MRGNHIFYQCDDECSYQSRFSKEKEPISYLQRDTSRDLLWELVYVVTEAEKSHHLPSASWGPREVSGGIQPQSKGLRTKGATALSL